MTSLTADALFVVLSGDRSGPTAALGRTLAPALGLPLLARDTLRSALAEELAEALGDAERLGRACATALVALAADCGGGVLDGIDPDDAALRAVDGTVVEVNCSPAGAAGTPSAGTPGPGGAGWPVVRVDSSAPVDVEPLADEVVAAASGATTSAPAGTPWVVWRRDAAGQRVEVARRDTEAVAHSVAAAMSAAMSAAQGTATSGAGAEPSFVVTPAE